MLFSLGRDFVHVLNKGDKIKITDLIDLHFLQQFQDAFACAMNVASIIVDEQGPITKPSNFTDVCYKCTRTSPLGFQRCNECDIRWGKLAALKGEPQIYDCHMGLTDFAVPIIVEGQHIGSILGGQILTTPPDELAFRKKALDIGIDPEVCLEYLRNVPIVPRENIEAAAKFLFLVANIISEVGLKNLELEKQNIRETLYRKIIEAIRKTLNIADIKRSIVNIIGKTLNADRCFIYEYDQKNETFKNVENEYLSSDDIKPVKGINVNLIAPNFANSLKKGKPVIINNKQILVDSENNDFELEKQAIEHFNINSLYSFPLFYDDDFLGVLSIHYVKSKKNISESDINLISALANQISIALHQGHLYELTQIQTEKEKISRNIIEILRSSLERNTIIHLFVKNIGKYFGADRVFFADYDPIKHIFLPFPSDAEYLSSLDKKSFVGYDWAQAQARDYVMPLLEKKEFKIFCWDEYKSNNILTTDFISLFEDADVKSSYNIPVTYQQSLLGYFCIEFTQRVYRLDKEEIGTIRNICTQAGIALYHSDLYEKVQNSALSKETFIANISKELKFPVNKIIELTDELEQEEVETEEKNKIFTSIRERCKQLVDLRNDIITVSHIESENFELEYNSFSISELFSSVLESARKISSLKGITLSLEEDGHAEIEADRKMITLAFYNIFSAAIKLLTKGSKILVMRKIEENHLITDIMLFIENDDLELKNEIFAKFKQIDSDFSRPRQEAGVELLISKKIIDEHNGSITVNSAESAGTHVTVVLPNIKAY